MVSERLSTTQYSKMGDGARVFVYEITALSYYNH